MVPVKVRQLLVTPSPGSTDRPLTKLVVSMAGLYSFLSRHKLLNLLVLLGQFSTKQLFPRIAWLPPGLLFILSLSSTKWILWSYLMPKVFAALWAAGSPQFFVVFFGPVCFVDHPSVGWLLNTPEVKDFLCPSMDEKKIGFLYSPYPFFRSPWRVPPLCIFLIMLSPLLCYIVWRFFWDGLQYFLFSSVWSSFRW